MHRNCMSDSSPVLMRAVAVALCAALAAATPLDDYVKKPDASYKYEDLGLRIQGKGFTGYVLNMTSQQWLTPQDSNIHTWFHDVVVIVPDNVRFTDTGFLWITGGGQHHDLPKYSASDEDIMVISQVCMKTGLVGAALFQVPNQPAVFTADPRQQRRSEDAVIAYTWAHFLDHPEQTEWPLRLPMTKAAVRALDTLEDYAPKVSSARPTRFIAGGASKRGWTTWTLGAVEPRLVGIVPIVLDALHFSKFMHTHFRAYGGWSFALKDYYDMNITARIDDPNLQTLSAIVDPVSYAKRLTMPKLSINAVGDEFQLPDDSVAWYNEMPSEMFQLMVQNAEHSLATGLLEVLPAVEAFAITILHNATRPQLLSWNIDPYDGRITAKVSAKPRRARMWFGSTVDGKRRDFRWAAIVDPCPTIKIFGGCLRPILWLPQNLAPVDGDNTYVAAMAPPGLGWRAFFIEFIFDNPVPGSPDFVFTTPVSVVPNTFPYQDCHGQGCMSGLV